MFIISIIINTFITYVLARAPFPDQTTSTFLNQALTAHNNLRALHANTGPLTLDQNIVAYSQSRCNLISQYQGLGNGHNGLLPQYGENLYWAGATTSAAINPSDAIQSWYNEISYYSWSNPGFSSSAGHFTQLVWVGTTRLGCATCGGQGSGYYENYVVCNYQMPGNVYGQFPANVQPLGPRPQPTTPPVTPPPTPTTTTTRPTTTTTTTTTTTPVPTTSSTTTTTPTPVITANTTTTATPPTPSLNVTVSTDGNATAVNANVTTFSQKLDSSPNTPAVQTNNTSAQNTTTTTTTTTTLSTTTSTTTLPTPTSPTTTTITRQPINPITPPIITTTTTASTTPTPLPTTTASTTPTQIIYNTPEPAYFYYFWG